MKTIYRYTLIIEDEQEVLMAENAQVLSVERHREHPSRLEMWAIVDTDKGDRVKEFSIRGTGHPFQGNEGRFIGSVQTHDGMFVWHVFETLD